LACLLSAWNPKIQPVHYWNVMTGEINCFKIQDSHNIFESKLTNETLLNTWFICVGHTTGESFYIKKTHKMHVNFNKRFSFDQCYHNKSQHKSMYIAQLIKS
jgi:hypothetical protein